MITSVKIRKKWVEFMSYDELMTAYKNLQSRTQELQIENNNLKLQVNSLQRMIFGSKREKTPVNTFENQCSIFDTEEEIEQNVQEQIEEVVEEIVVHKKKNSKKKNAGLKKSILKDVVIKRNEFVITEEDQIIQNILKINFV